MFDFGLYTQVSDSGPLFFVCFFVYCCFFSESWYFLATLLLSRKLISFLFLMILFTKHGTGTLISVYVHFMRFTFLLQTKGTVLKKKIENI